MLKQLWKHYITTHASCNVKDIIERIQQYLPDETITTQCLENSNVLIHLQSRASTMTITDQSSWPQVKRYIDSTDIEKEETACPICTEHICTTSVGCAKCATKWCVECYINIYRANKGIIICPFCRDKYGFTQPEWMIENGIRIIREKSRT